MTAVDMSQDLAAALRALLEMLDNGSHGLKASAGPRSNECGCQCCDDDDVDDIREQINEILESEAATAARRLLSRWEWA